MLAALILTTLVATQPQRALTVEEVVREAVAHNRDLLQHRLEARRASSQETAAWWGFTPNLNVRAGVSEIHDGGDLAVTSGDVLSVPILAGASRSADSAVGLAWSTPVGTNVSAELQLQRAFSGPSSASDGAVVLSLAQPLLKDAWLPGAGPSLEETSLVARIARETLRSEVESFIATVESAYWDLAVAQADVEIKTRSLERARQQREDTAENIRRGILADVEIYLVDENLVFFESELARAVDERAGARRHLASLLWLEPDAELAVSEELAALPAADRAPADSSASLAAAAATSPVLAVERLRADLARERERTAFMHALPRLDVDGALAISGKGIAGHPAAERVFTSPTPDARVGLVFSLPLGQPAVQASVDAEHIESARSKLELESASLGLRHDVEGAAAELALDLRLEDLGRRQLDLEDKKLTAQVDKYKNGISTLADVVRFQRDLDEASIAQRRAVRAVHVARARLLALEGRLAESTGVEVAP